MADKSFGVKQINLIGAAGTPTVESPGQLFLNANIVSISTSIKVTGDSYFSNSVGIGTTFTINTFQIGAGNSAFVVTGVGSVGIGNTQPRAQLDVVVPYASKSVIGLFSGTTYSDIVQIEQTGVGNALVIKQKGSGNALVVLDSYPYDYQQSGSFGENDKTPFVIDKNGCVGLGTNKTYLVTRGTVQDLMYNVKMDVHYGGIHFSKNKIQKTDFLDIVDQRPGGMVITSAFVNDSYYYPNSQTAYDRYLIEVIDSDPDRSLFIDSHSPLCLQTHVTRSKQYSTQRKVGIGSTSPNNKLDVIGDTYISGNTGIGTTNPTSKLHVIGDARIGIDNTQGVIITSSNGTKYRLVVSDAGALSTVLVT